MITFVCFVCPAIAAEPPASATSAVFSVISTDGADCIEVSIGNCRIRVKACSLVHPLFPDATVSLEKGSIQIRSGGNVVSGKRIELKIFD
jgi:hypothetical protein